MKNGPPETNATILPARGMREPNAAHYFVTLA